jgi:hypothetical protein
MDEILHGGHQPESDGNSLILHQNYGLLPGIFTKTIINGVPDAGKSIL